MDLGFQKQLGTFQTAYHAWPGERGDRKRVQMVIGPFILIHKHNVNMNYNEQQIKLELPIYLIVERINFEENLTLSF